MAPTAYSTFQFAPGLPTQYGGTVDQQNALDLGNKSGIKESEQARAQPSERVASLF